MNVTLVPEHIAPLGFAEILTLAVTGVFTVIVMAFDVAGEPVTQESEDVIMQEIMLPLVREEEVYDDVVAPEILEPLSIHW